MLISEYIMVKICGRNLKYYNSIGYFSKNPREEVKIPIKDIYPKSRNVVLVKCDYCGETIEKVYRNLMIERNSSITRKDCCNKCSPHKRKETHMALYGVENTLQREETKEKIKQTNLERYGTEFASQSKEVKEKIDKTNSLKTEEEKSLLREKTEKTCLDRYGVKSTLQLDKCRENLFKARSSSSSQQKEIFNILVKKYGGKRVKENFFFNKLSFDILITIKKVKIDIEYDSWYWHRKKRDRRRDEFVKSNGFKVLRIKSGKKIPEENLLFSKIESLVSSDKKFSKIILDDWNEEEYSKNGEG